MIHKFFKYLIHNQVIFALFLFAFSWLFIQILDIILSVFLSYIIMASILPMVMFLKRRKFPNILAVAIPYFSVLIIIMLLILPLIPFIISQIQSLISGFPLYFKQATDTLGLPLDSGQIQQYITAEFNNISKNAFTFTTKLFGGLFSLMMILIVSFYMLLYYNEIKKAFASFFHSDKHPYIHTTLDKINTKLGAWLRGQIVLMLFIGLLSWICLTLLGLPRELVLPLALLAGILEIVPTLGPIISAVPAVIVALTISPALAVSVIIAYILIQLVENNLLVPKIMEKAVGLNPIVIILGVIVGANLVGISGALLAIPLITFIMVIFKSIERTQS